MNQKKLDKAKLNAEILLKKVGELDQLTGVLAKIANRTTTDGMIAVIIKEVGEFLIPAATITALFTTAKDKLELEVTDLAVKLDV